MQSLRQPCVHHGIRLELLAFCRILWGSTHGRATPAMLVPAFTYMMATTARVSAPNPPLPALGLQEMHTRMHPFAVGFAWRKCGNTSCFICSPALVTVCSPSSILHRQGLRTSTCKGGQDHRCTSTCCIVRVQKAGVQPHVLSIAALHSFNALAKHLLVIQPLQCKASYCLTTFLPMGHMKVRTCIIVLTLTLCLMDQLP